MTIPTLVNMTTPILGLVDQKAPVQLFNYRQPDEILTVPNGTVWLAYRGSVAHGMYVPPEDPNSIDDIDLMGVVIGEPKHYLGLSEWGSRGTKEIKQGHYDCVFYDIRKMVSLLLQGNPNVMSMLWARSGDTLVMSSVSTELRANRHLFIGKHVYNAFAGYAHAQMEKMELRDPAELREYLAVTAEMKFRGIHPNHKGEKFPAPDRSTGVSVNVSAWGDESLKFALSHYQKKGDNIGYLGEKRKQLVLEHGYDSKNAAHLIRLLRMCKEFMETGEMWVYRHDAAELLDIKKGKWGLDAVKEHAAQLFAECKDARDKSSLPDGPERDKVERILVDILWGSMRGGA